MYLQCTRHACPAHSFDRLDKEIVAPLRNSALVAVKELFDAAWQPSPTRDRSISEKFRKEV